MGQLTKFKVGDEVEVVRGKWWIHEGKIKWVDEDRIGSTGIVTNAHQTQGIDHYSLDPLIAKGFQPFAYAWYHNDDLKLKYRPEYNEL